MKKNLHQLLTVAVLAMGVTANAQKSGLESINSHDLKMHMDFLASDELAGRNTGEPGLIIAAKYLSVQAEMLGLQSADPENGFFQFYDIEERSYNRENTKVTLKSEGQTKLNKDPFYVLPAMNEDTLDLTGEVVFAGYGVNDAENNYNDLEGLDLNEKIVMIMNRAPLNEDGTEFLFNEEKWSGMQSMQYKVMEIAAQQPRAILIVMDPKSGFNSISDANPGIENYFGRSRSLKGSSSRPNRNMPGPKILLIHRSLADDILAQEGHTLDELQKQIDKEVKPNSFITGVEADIHVEMKTTDIEVPNVFGIIEGSDPKLKQEMVIYMAHFDHVGTDGQGGVFNGADDNASGSVALIEIAQAFLKEKKRPRRSIGILWVSAEEIGLFGSSYFANHPLVPLENIKTVINLDMVARTRTEEDNVLERSDLTIQPMDSLEVIGGLQSSILMDINKAALEEVGLKGDYMGNNLDNPNRFFYRSDHINFARKDIPVLFYSTGTHNDYHTVRDKEARLDYTKFEKVTELSFLTGFNVANYKGEILVDNPMSEW